MKIEITHSKTKQLGDDYVKNSVTLTTEDENLPEEQLIEQTQELAEEKVEKAFAREMKKRR